MKKHLALYIESYLYRPSFLGWSLSFLLLPLTLIYCFIICVKYIFSKEVDYGIAVINVGNLVIGGSGKTPLVTFLANNFEKSAIILRGYGRDSKGMYVVRDLEKINYSVDISGDEATIYAHKCKNSFVIVSEDRVKAIKKAKELGAKIIFLDDAYSKHNIKKLNILIDIETKNKFCLPSGPKRQKYFKNQDTFFIKEDVDFRRVVSFKNLTKDMALVTSIARSSRLDKYLPDGVSVKFSFEDHHKFKKNELEKILSETKVQSLLVTYKDFVKMSNFDFPLSLMDLELDVDKKILDKVKNYAKKY